MMLIAFFKKWYIVPVVSVLGFLLSFKATPLIGAKNAFFSLFDLSISGLGLLGYTGPVILLYAVRSLARFSLLTHFPSFVGGWYATQASVFIRVSIPFVCMVLFLGHPIGFLAYGYTCFWLIPLCAARAEQPLIRALNTTLISHAVGSVIWLYTRNLSVAQWWGLIPVVAVERLCAAIMITAWYYSYQHMSQFNIKKLILQRVKLLLQRI